MPIGLTSDEDFQKELDRLSGQSGSIQSDKPVVEIMERPGRKTGDVNVPDALRQIIGEDAVINGRQSAIGLAGMFGISPSSVSAYSKGATSTTTYNEPKSSIRDHISKSRQRAIKRAQRTLDGALSAITQEKLDYTDAKDLSGIAKDMSVIIKNLEPPAPTTPTSDSNQPQFVIFAPQFRDERSFGHITVSE
jgi:predicted transcriptional regulator